MAMGDDYPGAIGAVWYAVRLEPSQLLQWTRIAGEGVQVLVV
jgi:hypothetical protein